MLRRLFAKPKPADEPNPDHLAEAVTEVRAELVRADSKASMLLALSGAGVAVAASSDLLASDSPAVWAIRAGLAVLVAAVVVLLLVVRPKLAGAPFMTIGTPGWRPETPQERMRNLSAVARAKFTRIRIAVDLLITGVVLLGGGIAWAGVV